MKLFQKKMRNLFKRLMRTSLINRWIVFEIDLFLCIIGYSFAAYIQIKNSEMDISGSKVWVGGSLFVLSNIISFIILKSYKGLIRHSSLIEMWRLYRQNSI